MSAVWNKRDDEYGGTLEKRMRFPVEIVEAIRGAVGPDMPILFRIACKHHFEGGRTIEETMPMLKILEEAGVNALDIDSGSYENIDYIFPPAYLGDACMQDVCEDARKAVTIPILNSGNHTPETAVKLLESGNADFIMMGRPLIAEPHMANKLMAGKREEVRPCIRCNEDCIGRILTRLTKISCSVNPMVGFEDRFTITKTANPQNIVVIGGGPGGMEAARTASLMGHKVTLFEKDSELGGQLKNADRIIVATGAVPVTPKIPGIENTIDILTSHTDPQKLEGEKIIFCGGGLSACDSALETAMSGKKVAIIEMLDEVAINDHFINKASLIPMFLKNGVELHTGHKVLEIRADGVKTRKKDGTEEFISGNTIVSAFGMVSNNAFAKAVDAKYHLKTRVIGDSFKVGKVGGAVREGMYAALSVE